MNPMPDTYMYVRINHPSFAEERLDFNFFSDLANVAYTVPLMHDVKESEALGKADDMDAQGKIMKLEEDNRDLEEIIENQKVKLEELLALDQARYLQLFQGQNMIYGRLNKDPFAEVEETVVQKSTRTVEQDPDIVEPEEPGKEEEDILELAKEEKPCKGLKVTFRKVEKLLGTKPFKVEMKIFYENREITDESGELVEHTSGEYKSKAKSEKKPEDVTLKDVVKSPFNYKGLYDLLKKKKKKTQNCYIRWRITRVY